MLGPTRSTTTRRTRPGCLTWPGFARATGSTCSVSRRDPRRPRARAGRVPLNFCRTAKLSQRPVSANGVRRSRLLQELVQEASTPYYQEGPSPYYLDEEVAGVDRASTAPTQALETRPIKLYKPPSSPARVQMRIPEAEPQSIGAGEVVAEVIAELGASSDPPGSAADRMAALAAPETTPVPAATPAATDVAAEAPDPEPETEPETEPEPKREFEPKVAANNYLGAATKRNWVGRRCSVWLPPRSLLVLSGEARYGWSHGIAQRLTEQRRTPACGPPTTATDPAAANDSRTGAPKREKWENKDTERRGVRYSLTFRRIRTAANPCRCAFPRCCDARTARAASVGRHGQQQQCSGGQLEANYVRQAAAQLLHLDRSAQGEKSHHLAAPPSPTVWPLKPPALLLLSPSRTGGDSSPLHHINTLVDCWWQAVKAAPSSAVLAVMGSGYAGLGQSIITPVVVEPLQHQHIILGFHWLIEYLAQLRFAPPALVATKSSSGGVSNPSMELVLNETPAGLPLRDGCCDAVLVAGVLDQLSTVEARAHCIGAVLRALAPGGEACFTAVSSAAPRLRPNLGADILVPIHVPVVTRDSATGGTTAVDGSSGKECNGEGGGRTVEMYFHCFEAGELEKAVESVRVSSSSSSSSSLRALGSSTPKRATIWRFEIVGAEAAQAVEGWFMVARKCRVVENCVRDDG